jgi:acyl-CoA hydrolase
MTQWDLTPRPSTESETVLVELMTAHDANILGTVHGGTVMKLVDTAAGLAAIRHAGGVAVTASIDRMSFHAPVRVGNLLHVRACVNDAGHTSMEVGVRVEAEDIVTGRRRHTASAYVVMVAIDDDGAPRPVPPLVPGDDAARTRQREARLRREARLDHERSIEGLRAGATTDGDDRSGDGDGDGAAAAASLRGAAEGSP